MDFLIVSQLGGADLSRMLWLLLSSMQPSELKDAWLPVFLLAIELVSAFLDILWTTKIRLNYIKLSSIVDNVLVSKREDTASFVDTILDYL